jgi:hypothetical protein
MMYTSYGVFTYGGLTLLRLGGGGGFEARGGIEIVIKDEPLMLMYPNFLTFPKA